MLARSLNSLVGIGSRLRGRFIFPFLAFVIPLLLRAVPEILMGPYSVGFDTMGYYVPNIVMWQHGGISLWNYIAAAPLFYSLVVLFVASGGPLILALKIIPVLLHGFLGLSIYVYAQKGLDWSPRKSTMTALLSTVYFVALRVSWDLLRNELAFIFFFVVLTLLSARKDSAYSWKRYVLLSLAMMAVVLAHQLVSVIMLGVVVFTIVHKLLRKEHAQVVNLIVVSLPAAFFFIIIYVGAVLGHFSFDFSINSGWPLYGFSSYQSMLTSEVGFFLYCYLPLLPLVLVSIKRFGNLQLRSWVLLSSVLLFIPIDILSNFRWVLMFTYPLAFYVSDTMSKIKAVSWKRFRFTLYRLLIIYLVLMLSVLSLGFMLMPPEKPLPYFDSGKYNGYIYQIPSSMLQNTVSIIDCQDTTNALHWFKDTVGENAFLLTHQAFYGWALSTLSRDQVVLYEFDNPENAAATVAQEGHSQIYLIWWINGQGWYGQTTVPSSFVEVYHSGRIAVYSYLPNNMTNFK